VQPDLFVARLEEVRTMDWSAVKTLLLVIEVMSPGTARADRFVKRRLYQKQQIPTYWIVDPEAKLVEVWTPEAVFPTVVTDTLEWRPEGIAEPCVIQLEELFGPI
jgi:Uma2 family endonuclease